MKNSIDYLTTKATIAAMAIACIVLLPACEEDDPQREDTPELITKAILTFTPDTGTPVAVIAVDPDGAGTQNLIVEGVINLSANTAYTLDITLLNELADASSPEFDISEEVKEESDEHMFFYSWTNNIFSAPTGDGNIDNRADAVNYEDEDSNGLPLGLKTSWHTADVSSGNFRVVLKHQPGLKTETSGVSAGETDLDVTFEVEVD